MVKKYVPIGLGFAAPFVAFGQNIQGVLGVVQNLLNLVIPILITLAVVTFFWGLAKFIWSIGDENAKADVENHAVGSRRAFCDGIHLGHHRSYRQYLQHKAGWFGSNLIPRVQ